MASSLSIAQMLTELQGQIAHHRRQSEHHAQEEVVHREKAAFHAAELETAERRFEAFQAAAAEAGELVERHRAASAPPPPGDEALPAGKRRPVARLVARIVQSRRADEVFSPTDIAAEINQRYGARLKKHLDGRAASVTLRRLAATGALHLVREGTAHREGLYSRTRPAAQR